MRFHVPSSLNHGLRLLTAPPKVRAAPKIAPRAGCLPLASPTGSRVTSTAAVAVAVSTMRAAPRARPDGRSAEVAGVSGRRATFASEPQSDNTATATTVVPSNGDYNSL